MIVVNGAALLSHGRPETVGFITHIYALAFYAAISAKAVIGACRHATD